MKNWITENWRKILIGSLAAIFIVIIALFLARTFGNLNRVDRTALDANAGEFEDAVRLVASPLTGREVTERIAKQPVIGSMISNSFDARPQSGLEQAGVVFEAIAEGGITRYLALFQDEQPAFLGPVRSLRPYFIDFARTFNAYVAHVGGSPRALNQARTELGERDLDQFRYGTQAFDRVDFRFAPHNVYTSYQRLRNLAAENATSSFTPLLRKSPEPSTTPNATDITVNFSKSTYNTRWVYSPENNNYLRFIDGNPHKDRETENQLAFDVVVVIRTSYSIFVENGTSYNDVGTTGSGEALIFQDGVVTEATWEKSSATAQYSFTTAGQNVALNTGKVWFAIQPTSQTTSYE